MNDEKWESFWDVVLGLIVFVFFLWVIYQLGNLVIDVL